MTDDRLDDLMVSMMPISEARVAELPLSGPETDLMEAIMSTSRQTPVEPDATLSQQRVGEHDDVVAGPYPSPPEHVGRRSGRRTRLAIAVAAAAAVLVAALLWQPTGQQPDVDVAATEPQAPQVDPAVDNGPWILADVPGWEMTETISFGEPPTTMSQTTFSDGSHRLNAIAEVFGVAPPPSMGQVVGDEELGLHPVLGHEAEIRRSMTDRKFLADWAADNVKFRVVSDVPTVERFYELLDSLREVDFETFADALPASYVAPGDQPALVEELMTDVPRPAGFDPAALVLDNRGVGEKRREIVNLVGSAAVCGWVEHWIAAVDAGDEAGARQSVDALRTFLDAPIVDEMRASRGYFRVRDHFPVLVEEFAAAMAEGRPVLLTGQGPDLEPIPGEPYPVRDVYHMMLGCYLSPAESSSGPGELAEQLADGSAIRAPG